MIGGFDVCDWNEDDDDDCKIKLVLISKDTNYNASSFVVISIKYSIMSPLGASIGGAYRGEGGHFIYS